MSNSIDTTSLLQQLQSMAQDAGIPSSRPSRAELVPPERGVEFSKLLESSLETVNNRSADVRELQQSFEAGNPNIELADVMIAAQKARISFEAMTQVRNKMVSAYREIMSMPL